MNGALSNLAIYAAPALVAFGIYGGLRSRNAAKARAVYQQATAAGLTEPPSLHPLIDVARCIGCGSCVRACPEEQVLGLIAGKSVLANPTHCIGHGACEEACPTRAITLVFGTERRGVDIPEVKPNFETNVPGVFIAGELGGMGLIRNAVEQGRQAVAAIHSSRARVAGDQADLVVVGAGPAGFAASLQAMEYGLNCVTLEQEVLGGTVAHYPRGKIVMTAPTYLPMIGEVPFRETTKEVLLDFWTRAAATTGVCINYGERVEEVGVEEDGFLVRSNSASYRTRSVLLAIGRRGTPRKLGVPGEESERVVYRLIDPEQYRGCRILVVGGGDSALEAAIAVAGAGAATVTLTYRGDAFSRAKQANRERIKALQDSNSVRVAFNTEVRTIVDSAVMLEVAGEEEYLPNDTVIVCAGGVLPRAFLEAMGVDVHTKHGTR